MLEMVFKDADGNVIAPAGISDASGGTGLEAQAPPKDIIDEQNLCLRARAS